MEEVFPAHANTGDPDGPSRPVRYEVARALISMMVRSKTAPTSVTSRKFVA
jgi:hypothetical protein